MCKVLTRRTEPSMLQFESLLLAPSSPMKEIKQRVGNLQHDGVIDNITRVGYSSNKIKLHLRIHWLPQTKISPNVIHKEKLT